MSLIDANRNYLKGNGAPNLADQTATLLNYLTIDVALAEHLSLIYSSLMSVAQMLTAWAHALL
jgi:hypothetical protein